MTKPDIKEERQAVDKVNNLLSTPPKKKAGFFKRVLAFTHLAKEVGEFTFDESKASDKIKKDILDIEADRLKAHMAAISEREKRENANNQIKEPVVKTEIKKEKKPGFFAKLFGSKKKEDLKNKEIFKTPLANEKSIPSPVSLPTPVIPVAPKETASVQVKEDIIIDKPVELPPIVIEQKKIDEAIENMPAPLGEPINKPKTGMVENIKPETPAPIKAVPVKAEPVVPAKVVSPVVEQKHSFHEAKSGKAKKFAEELKHALAEASRQSVENRFWQPLNMVRANLVKDQRSLFYNWTSKLLSLVFVSCISILVVLIGYGGLFYWQGKKEEGNKDLVANAENIKKQIKIEEAKMEDIKSFNNSLLYVAYLLDNHIYWSNFFKLLEDRTIKNIYFEKFAGDLKGAFKIPGVAKDNESVSLASKVFLYVDDPIVQKADPGNIASDVNDSVVAGSSQTAIDANNAQTAQIATEAGIVSTVKNQRRKFNLDVQINPQVLLYNCYKTREQRCALKKADKIAMANNKTRPYICPYFTYADESDCKQ